MVAFYEELRAQYPDQPPRGEPSPWMSMLEAGIDHVVMHLSFAPYSTPAIAVIQELAAAHGLVMWDPQSDEAYLPDRAAG